MSETTKDDIKIFFWSAMASSGTTFASFMFAIGGELLRRILSKK